MINKLKFSTLLVLFTFMVSLVLADNLKVRDPYKHFFNETWGDLPEELKKAKAEGKKGILIFFELVECPFCHYMKKNVLNQQKVQDFYRKNFLNFVVDIEGDVEMVNLKGKTVKQKDFAKKHRVRATPVIAYFNLEGKIIYRHTGKTSGVDEFMWLGEYIANGLYKKKIRFSKFKRQKRAEKKRK